MAATQQIASADGTLSVRGRPAGLIIEVGMRFGRLVAISLSDVKIERKRMWLCKCDCGKTKLIRAVCLRNGATKSCGCGIALANLARMPHGMTKSSEHKVWRQIIQRCENPNASGYDNYGGRGIQICEEWRADFLAFFASVGPRPSPAHSIDREDNNGDYKPGNCKSSSRQDQAENTRKARFWIVDGISYPSVSAAGEAIGVTGSAIIRRCNGYFQGGKHYPPKQNCYSTSKYEGSK